MHRSVMVVLIFAVLSYGRATKDSNGTENPDDDPAKEGEEVSNNLFSDLGPLLALFGEKVAQQFMSESMGWADHIIFAMAPLGMITALVGAIRVGGPSWLRAIIGRARENNGSAEVELQSSTSNNVCELWNGDAIVRVMGAPEITELQLGIKPGPKSTTQPNESNKRIGMKSIESGLRRRMLPKRKQAHAGDVESVLQASSPVDESATTTEETKYNGLTTVFLRSPGHPDPKVAPNMSLNATNDYVRTSELWVAAGIGTCLQLGAIIYWTMIVYWIPEKFPKQRSERVANYAYPLTAFGTLAIVSGMVICSYVVGHSTKEENIPLKTQDAGHSSKEEGTSLNTHVVEHSTKGEEITQSGEISAHGNADKDLDRRIMWIQKGGKISDQDFESYVVFGKGTRKNVRTSRIWKHTSGGQERWTTIGTFLSIGGFFTQFMGFRSMHWSAAIAQLGATIIMMVIRSWVRRKLVGRPKSQRLPHGFELEWLASRYEVLWQRLEEQEEDKNLASKQGKKYGDDSLPIKPRRVVPLRELDNQFFWSQIQLRNWIVLPGVGAGKTLEPLEGDPSFKSPYAHRMMKVRRELGRLTRWRSGVHAKAEILERSIKIVMDSLFDRPEDLDGAPKVRWCIKIVTPEGVNECYLTIIRNENSGKWDSTPHELEAVLSLWMYSLKGVEAVLTSNNKQKQEGKCPEHPDGASNCLGPDEPADHGFIGSVRRLGASTVTTRRDYRWWMDQHIPEDILEMTETRKAELFTSIGKYRVMGFEDQAPEVSDDTKATNPTPIDHIVGSKKQRPMGAVASIDSKTTIPMHVDHIAGSENQNPASSNDTNTTNAPHIDYIASLSSVSTYYTAPIEAVDSKQQKEKNHSATLGIFTDIDVDEMCTYELFAQFMWAVARSLSKRIESEISIIHKEASTAQSFEGKDKGIHHPKAANSARGSHASKISHRDSGSDKEYHFSLQAPIIHEIAKALEETALGTIGDIYCCIIPPLSHLDRLPDVSESLTNWVSEKARIPEALGDFQQAGDLYLWLFRVGITTADDSPLKLRGTVTLVDFYRRLTKVLLLWHDLGRRDQSYLKLTNLGEKIRSSLTTLVDPNKIILGLTRLYTIQERLSEFENKEITPSLRLPFGDTESRINKDALETPFLAYSPAHSRARYLIKLGTNKKALDNYNGRDILQWTPLHYVTINKRTDSTAAILKKGLSNVNVGDIAGWTPLHYAAWQGIPDSTQALLLGGARIDAQGRDGMTSLHCAASRGHNGVLRKLLEAGASVEIQDSGRRTALHWGAYSGQSSVVTSLLEAAAYIRARDDYGRTPLHYAVLGGKDVLRALVEHVNKEHRSDFIELKDRAGQTSLHAAVKLGKVKMISALFESGASSQVLDDNNNTLLHLLAHENAGYKTLQSLYTCVQEENDQKTTAKDVFGRQILYYGLSGRDKWGRTPLHLAALAGNVEMVNLLLNENADITAVDHDGRSAVHLAAKEGKIHVLELLVGSGGDVTQQDTRNGWTPFQLALSAGMNRVVEWIAETKEIILNVRDRDGLNALQWVVRTGQYNAAKKLLDLGFDVNLTDTEFGWTTLHFAAGAGFIGGQANLTDSNEAKTHTDTVQIIKLLLDRRANIEARDERYKRTALHWAAATGNDLAVETLLQHMATEAHEENINKKDGLYGRTSLHLAAREGYHRTVDILLDYGADINDADEHGRTPLQWAVEGGHQGTIETLEKRHPAVPVKKFEDMSEMEKGSMEIRPFSLHWATWSRNIPLMEFLLSLPLQVGKDGVGRHKINIESLDEVYGQTALHWAAQGGCWKVLQLLLDRGARVGAVDAAYGRTPLHWAVIAGNSEMVQILLTSEFGIEARAELLEGREGKGKNRTPFEIADEKEDFEMMELLKKVAADCNVEISQDP